MIADVVLETNQPMFTYPTYLVCVGSIYTADTLVQVYKEDHPEQQVAYYALFIATGELP